MSLSVITYYVKGIKELFIKTKIVYLKQKNIQVISVEANIGF